MPRGRIIAGRLSPRRCSQGRYSPSHLDRRRRSPRRRSLRRRVCSQSSTLQPQPRCASTHPHPSASSLGSRSCLRRLQTRRPLPAPQGLQTNRAQSANRQTHSPPPPVGWVACCPFARRRIQHTAHPRLPRMQNSCNRHILQRIENERAFNIAAFILANWDRLHAIVWVG